MLASSRSSHTARPALRCRVSPLTRTPAPSAPTPGPPLTPLALKAADDIAVAIAQHRRQSIMLVPDRDEERPAMNNRIGQDLGRKAHALECRRDLVLEIDAKL